MSSPYLWPQEPSVLSKLPPTALEHIPSIFQTHMLSFLQIINSAPALPRWGSRPGSYQCVATQRVPAPAQAGFPAIEVTTVWLFIMFPTPTTIMF